MRGLAAFALLWGACYAPSAQEGAPCGPGDACPSGQVCDRGVCLLEARPDDAAIQPSDSVVDGGPDAAYVPCSGATLFTDAFDNTTAAPLFEMTAGTGMTVTEGSDRLTVSFAASVTAPSYGFYSSTISYTTSGLCVRAEVSELAEANGITFFKLTFGPTEVEFFAMNGSLELRTKAGAEVISRKSITVDVASLRYWRLRFEGGTTYWDTASTDEIYTEQLAVDDAFPATSGYIVLGAGAASDVIGGDKATFESIQAARP